MTLASDNDFPSILIKEGSAPASPGVGDQRLFIDSSDHLPKLKNNGGTVTPLGGMTNPMVAVDDMIIGGTAGAPARLTAAGAPSKFLQTDGSNHVVWGTAPASSGLLAVTQYLTSGNNSYVISTGSDADVDATNLKVVFTAPASGNVVVKISSLYNDSTSGTCNMFWTVRESTTTLATNYMSSGVAKAIRGNATFYITGVSGGSHTYKFGAYQGSGTNATIYYGTTAPFGPIIIEVWSAP